MREEKTPENKKEMFRLRREFCYFWKRSIRSSYSDSSEKKSTSAWADVGKKTQYRHDFLSILFVFITINVELLEAPISI